MKDDEHSNPGEGAPEREQDPSDAELSEAERILASRLAEFHDQLTRSDPRAFDELVAEYPELVEEFGGESRVFELLEEEYGRVPDQIDDYRIIREAGRGGMGVVYEAEQVSLGRKVALKILPPSYLGDRKSFARFRREARAVANLRHPSIVEVYATGMHSGTPYYVMEFAEGATLRQLENSAQESSDTPEDARWKMLRSLPTLRYATDSDAPEQSAPATATMEEAWPALAAEYRRLATAFAGAADGMQHAHSRGVVHRDIKPANLMMDSSGTLRILDFGLAQVEGQPQLTLTGERVGTPLYMSPEQTSDRPKRLTPSSDIYSFGATLYQTLTLSPPVTGRDWRETLEKIRVETPTPVRTIAPEVPIDLETIVMKCLEKAPGRRYGTAEALSQDLIRFGRGDPIEARPPTVIERAGRWLRKHRRRTLEISVGIILVAAIGYAGLSHDRTREAEKESRYERSMLNGVASLLQDQLQSDTTAIELEAELIPVDPAKYPLHMKGPGKHQIFQYQPTTFEMGPGLVPADIDPSRRAVRQFEEAAALFPRRAVARYYLARALQRDHRAREALAQVDACLDHAPEFVPALHLRALLSGDGAVDRDRDEDSTVDSTTEHGSAWAESWVRAHEAVLAQRWETAANALATVHSEFSPNGESDLRFMALESHLALGVAYLKIGKPVLAIEPFVRGAESRPDWLAPRLLLAKAYAMSREPAMTVLAERRFREALATLPPDGRGFGSDAGHDDLVASIARTYVSLEDYDSASRWVERTRDSARLALRQSEILRAQGKIQEAATRSGEVVAAAPTVEACLVHGNNLLAGLRFESAQAAFRDALEQSKESRIHVALGLTHERSDELSAAVTEFRRALSLDETSTLARYHLARVLRKSERYDDAIHELERLVADDPWNGHALNNLGILYDLIDLQHEAAVHYERAFETNSGLGLAQYNLGWLRERQRDYPRAAEAYGKALDSGLSLPTHPLDSGQVPPSHRASGRSARHDRRGHREVPREPRPPLRESHFDVGSP